MADRPRRVADLPPDRLRELMDRLREKSRTVAAPVERRPRPDGPLPLSFSQERLWFLEKLGAGSAAYHVPAAARLSGPLADGVLEQVFAEVVRRHESLRTTFGERDGQPCQICAPPVGGPTALPRIDLSALPAAAREDELPRLVAELARLSFDLETGPLWRAPLVRLGPADHVLGLTLHHIISDGWSLGVLLREVAVLYEAFAAGRPSPLPGLPLQYADFALWQRERLQSPALEEHLAFWRQRLAGTPPLDLPADRPRPALAAHRGDHLLTEVPAGTADRLRELARGQGTTLFVALLALVQTLLLRYTGETDLAMGSAVANRDRTEIEGLIGFFVNTLVLRADLAGDPAFADLLRRDQEVALAAWSHQAVPFEKLVAELQPEREPGRNPFFQVLLNLQNQPLPAPRLGGLDFSVLEIHTGTAKVDLSFLWREEGRGLAGLVEYSADLFDRPTAERFLDHFQALLHGALEDPGRTVGELPLLGEAERRQVLVDWDGARPDYPREATVHELFAAQARRRGGAVAVEDDAERLTWDELAARANGLAHCLRRLGVRPDALVALAVPRSVDMVAAALGILQAGGAYLPLDPSYPEERLAGLLDEARPAALVTLEAHADALPARGIPTIFLDRDREALESAAAGPLESGATAESLAYAMYTSGSTGRPKAVAVPHRAVVRLVRGADWARLDGDQVFLQLAPLSFDASTLEIWGPLLNGGRLVLAPPGPVSLPELGRLLARHRVTTLWLTAGLFHQMIDEELDGLRGLSQLLAGGDALSAPHVRRALAGLPGCTLINGYGPTENTTFTCCHRIAVDDPPRTSVPIGRPVANTRVRLLDRGMRPVPVGVPGELCAGGDGLARGYLARPDLTAERFVPSPLAGREDEPGARLYRTGDLARWRPDGALDFLGRLDQQVKIRGFRIEPGEIEAALRAHPAVAEAAVVVRRDAAGDRRMMACVVPAPAAQISAAELRRALAARLPGYMVPSGFALLGEVPLTPNGKVDRRALERLDLPEDGGAEEAWEEPASPLERQIAAVWEELLGRSRIGRRDDFFALGGHSLLATRMVSRLRGTLGVEIPLAAVFEASTLSEMAAVVAGLLGARTAEAVPLEAAEEEGEWGLSFGQERLWFLDQLQPGGPAYNIPAAARLAGRLDPAVLAAAFAEVLRRHATLRTTFPMNAGGEPRPQVVLAAETRLPVVDLAALPEEARSREARRLAAAEAAAPFDLAAGPLLRTTLLRLGSDEHRLLLTLHHIVADGWSIAILVRETAALYEAFAAGRPSPLPELPAPVRGLRGLAAPPPERRGPRRRASLLARAPARRAAGAGAAHRPRPPGRGERARHEPPAPPFSRAGREGPPSRSEHRRHPVHGSARHLRGPALPPLRPDRPHRRHPCGRTPARRGRGPDWIFRQHSRAARQPGGRALVRRLPRPHPPPHPGGLRPPGAALREARRGGPARAQPGVHTAVPGLLRPAEHAGGAAASAGAHRGAAPAGELGGQVRPLPGSGRGGGRLCRRPDRQRRPVRRGDDPTLGRLLRAPPRGGHRGFRGERLRAPPARRGGAPDDP